MNFVRCRFTIISTILAMTMEIRSAEITAPDKKYVGNNFAELLNSLVNVNVERLDAMKNLLKLYDVKLAKRWFRTSQNEKDVAYPGEMDVFDKRDVFHKSINEPDDLFHNDKELCGCQNTVLRIDRHKIIEAESQFDLEEVNVINKDRPLSQNHRYRYVKPSYPNYKRPNREDQIVFYINSKQLLKGNGDTASLDYTSLQDDLSFQRRPRDSYEDCKLACYDGYEIVCPKEGFMAKLRKRLRKECKQACVKLFREPYQ